MSIAAECTTCGKKYQAPDNMAGKRVRCKQCGNIFELPGGDKSAASERDALTELESSFHSLDATGTAMPGSDGGDDDPEAGGSSAFRTARANVRFDYPLSKDIDYWLPRVLSYGGIALLALVCFKVNDTGVPWIWPIWFVVALLAYVMVVGPLSHAMIRRAGQYTGYQMPSSDRQRAFGSILAGYLLTYLLWSVGGGQIVALILGIIAGLAVTVGFVWLLFRLLPREVAPTAGYLGLGYALGIAICGGVMFGLNLLLIQVLIQTEKPDLIPASPIGQGFVWIAPEQRDAILAKFARSHPSNPTGPSTARSSALPVVNSPLVKKAALAEIDAPFEEVVPPLVDARFIATIRKADDNFNVTVWDMSNWKQNGSALFKSAPDAGGNRFILSPDGIHLARITTFPTLSAQIWNYSTNSNERFVKLDGALGTPELIGFLSEKNILVRWQQTAGVVLEIIDVSVPKTVNKLTVPNFEKSGVTLTISHDGTLAAIATKVNNAPTLLIYNLTTSTGDRISAQITSLGPQWPVTPTGMAFSNDSLSLAVLFEQAGNGLLLPYRIDAAQKQLIAGTERYPPGLAAVRDRQFVGNALAWTPRNDGWITYGQSVFSASKGSQIGELGQPNVQGFRIVMPEQVQVVTSPQSGIPRQVIDLGLDLDKIAALAK